MSEFRMPSLGSDMESGTLVEWLKRPGDAIKRGDIIAVVETQKGAIEVEIFRNGVMGAQLVPVGTTVPVGAALAVIEETGGEAGVTTPSAPVRIPEAPPPPLPAAAKVPVAPLEHSGIRASPAARKAAAERGIDLSKIAGSGPQGAITLHDVEAAHLEKPAAGPQRGLDLAKMREAIAAAMAHSKREIPHYYLATEIDLGAMQAWLELVNATRAPETRLLPAVLTLKAVALAARKYPAFNGFYRKETAFQYSKEIHVGAAIALRGGGLVSPAIHDCDQKSLDELMAALRDLVARARVGRLRSSEISDATITVSSLGERGVDQLFGVIYPPQVAIVGCGRMARKPVAVDQEVAVRPVMSVSLAADHRVSDGHAGALFLNEIGRLLQEPARL